MIRFRRIEIENFICFDNLTLEPSLDPDRPLTIVRAENGSGKTTLLRAFLWGMYGENGLPSDSRNFGLHLAEWEPDEAGMNTSVKIEFENDGTTRSDASSKRQVTKYQLIRRVTTVRPQAQRSNQPNFRRENESKELMYRSPDGRWLHHDHGVDSVVKQLLPIDLREFFVMDADQVVDFVGGSENKYMQPREVKRKTTQALHSLLGIDVFTDTSARLTTIARDFGASAARAAGKADLDQLQSRLELYRKDQDDLQDGLRVDKENRDDALGRLNECEDRLAEEIKGIGKLEGLNERKGSNLSRIGELRKAREDYLGKLSLTLESTRLFAALSVKEIRSVNGVLKPLHLQGKIPQRHLAFVEELLREGTCVCGQDLSKGNTYRERVEAMLSEGRLDQARSDYLGNLFDSTGALIDPDLGSRWMTDYENLSGEIASILQNIEDLELELRDIETQLNNVDSEKVQQLQAEKGRLQAEIEKVNQNIGAAESREPGIRREIESLEKTIDQRKRAEGAAKEERQAEQWTKLVGQIIAGAYDRILHHQVDELSKRMNSLFVRIAENAGDDEAEDLSERRATLKMITEVGVQQSGDEAFEIFARNRHGRLMPPTEINGASRRVLALSFVLALCKESRTDAPLVADSLLNFMSGTVRRNTLRVTSAQSSQPILLLTGADLESSTEAETVNRYAGATYTLTAQWHAREAGGGGDVVRQTQARTVSLLCGCGPREYCDICEREGQANSPGWTRRAEEV